MGLERLGDSHAFGNELLELLERAGWEISETTPFAGEGGVLVIARNGPFEVSRRASSRAAAAPEIFGEAAPLSGALGSRVAGDTVQLSMPIA